MCTEEVLAKIQTAVSLRDRDLIARAIAAERNKQIRNPYAGASNKGSLDELSHIGLTRVSLPISNNMCDDILRYFAETPCYCGHVPNASDHIARRVEEAKQTSNYGSYLLEESLRAPHLIELAMNEQLLDLVGGYLGCLPSFYSMNTFWTFPINNSGVTHLYHRDVDDFKFVAVFVYWTDVTISEGEFVYIRHSHDREWMDKKIKAARRNPLLRYRLEADDAEEFHELYSDFSVNNDAMYNLIFKNEIDSVCGPRGTAVISDTFNLHRGSLPKTRPRLVTWFRYGLYANDAYRADKTKPSPWSVVGSRIADNERNRFICRLVLN